MTKRIIFLVGETGSGKDTIAKELEYFHKVISYTTRPKRNTDVEGITHYFVTDEKMDELLKKYKKEDIIAYTNKGGARYFATRDELKEGNNIYIINPDGIEWFKKYGPKDIKYLTFYIHLGLRERMERCRDRSDFKEKFYNRVMEESGDFSEFRLGDDYDFIINNKNSKRSAEIIEGIVLTEEMREKVGKIAERKPAGKRINTKLVDDLNIIEKNKNLTSRYE